MTDGNSQADRVRLELERLRSVDLPAAQEKMVEAQGQGDASQNPDTFLAAEEIGRINARIEYLADRLTDMLIHRDGHGAGTVLVLDFGDGPEEYVLSHSPGDIDGRPAITFDSPLGRAVKDAEAGQTVRPAGRASVKVVAIRTEG